jgi:hypothetical protein
MNFDITDRKQIEGNLSYLAKVSKILSSSLDYNTTLVSVAKLGVPEMADWCSVAILKKDNTIRQLAVAHIDPKKVRWAEELNRKNPLQMTDPTGVAEVLRTGKSQFFPTVTEEMIVASAQQDQLN